MIARLVPLALVAFLSAGAAASAQITTQPQTPPNAGAAEAKPATVIGPGGATTLPAPGSQPAPAAYPDPGNDTTASPPLGPQHKLGRALNRTVHYVAGDYVAPPIVYDAFAAGNRGINYRSYAGRAVFEVPLGQYDVFAGVDGRRWTYPTTAGAVSGIGLQRRGIVPSFAAIDDDEDVRAGVKVTGPRVYGAVSYLKRGTTTGEPTERGLGYGIEKLADVDQTFSLYGSVYYYPNVGGRYTINGTGNYGVSYRLIRYAVGVTLSAPHAPVFLDAGFLGDKSRVRTDAPVGIQHSGPFVGVGIRF